MADNVSSSVLTAPVVVPTAVPIEVSAGAPRISANTERLPLRVKWAYASGGAADMLGHWLYFNMADPIYNGYFHLTPTQIGWVKAATLFADAFCGLLFGWLSDNTRSRWGRRRPFILLGSIVAGVALPLLFLPQLSWGPAHIFGYMLLSALLYSPLIAAYNSPYQALGSELTPDYNERSSVMGYKAIVQKTMNILLMGGLWFANLPWFVDPLTGKANQGRGAMAAAAIAGVLMITAGIINARFVPERYYATAKLQKSVGPAEALARTFSCRPFLVVLGIGFLFAIPSFAAAPLGYYAGYFYVLKDLHASGTAASTWGTLSFWGGFAYGTVGMLGIYPAQLLARRYGKRAALAVILASGWLAFVLSWVMYRPGTEALVVLHTALTGLCATGLWVILPSMTVDTIDYDEHRTAQRREGAFSSAFSWAMKAGMGMASIFAGQMLDALTGFRAELGGNQTPETFFMLRFLLAAIPSTACVLALGLLVFYRLSPARMADIRRDLEARRGTV
jgi:glycoside/pentoside/hexuronide:cation symporter, GPH family